jgi:hypothetical protein
MELSLLSIGRLGVIYDSQPHGYAFFIAIRISVKTETVSERFPTDRWYRTAALAE